MTTILYTEVDPQHNILFILKQMFSFLHHKCLRNPTGYCSSFVLILGKSNDQKQFRGGKGLMAYNSKS